MNKFLSWRERVNSPMPIQRKRLCVDYEVRSIDQYVDSGRVLKKSVVHVIHPQDKFAGFVASDFALENVIALGALDSLRDGKLNGDKLSIADSVEGSIDNIIAAVDSAEFVSKGE